MEAFRQGPVVSLKLFMEFISGDLKKIFSGFAATKRWRSKQVN